MNEILSLLTFLDKEDNGIMVNIIVGLAAIVAAIPVVGSVAGRWFKDKTFIKQLHRMIMRNSKTIADGLNGAKEKIVEHTERIDYVEGKVNDLSNEVSYIKGRLDK